MAVSASLCARWPKPMVNCSCWRSCEETEAYWLIVSCVLFVSRPFRNRGTTDRLEPTEPDLFCETSHPTWHQRLLDPMVVAEPSPSSEYTGSLRSVIKLIFCLYATYYWSPKVRLSVEAPPIAARSTDRASGIPELFTCARPQGGMRTCLTVILYRVLPSSLLWPVYPLMYTFSVCLGGEVDRNPMISVARARAGAAVANAEMHGAPWTCGRSASGASRLA
jgi:hypothetical protein